MPAALDVSNVGESHVDTTGSTFACTTSSAASSGSFIVATVTWFGTQTLSNLSGGGLTWVIDKQVLDSGRGLATVSAQAPSGLASGTSITATLSGSRAGGGSITFSSFTGVATSSPVDVATGLATFSSSGTWTTPSIVETVDGDLAIASVLDGTQDSTSSTTSPSTQLHGVNGGPGSYEAVMSYRIDATHSTLTISGTWSPTGQTGTVIAVAYKAAAGGGTTFNDSGTGTISLSGTGAQSHSHTAAAAGTIALSGSATQSQTHTGAGAGTVTLSGAGAHAATFGDSGTGTIALAGTGVQSQTHTATGAGTVTLTGSAVESNSGAPTAPPPPPSADLAFQLSQPGGGAGF